MNHETLPAQGPVNVNVRGSLTDDDVHWIVNDLGELGVEIGGRFFFLYKGESLEYGKHAETKDGVCLHDDETPMLYRMVGKREFGETQWPQKWVIAGRREERYTDKLVFHEGLSFGKPEDGDWKPLLAAPNAQVQAGSAALCAASPGTDS